MIESQILVRPLKFKTLNWLKNKQTIFIHKNDDTQSRVHLTVVYKDDWKTHVLILNETQESIRANRTNSVNQINFKLFLIKMFKWCIPFHSDLRIFIQLNPKY